MAYVIVPKKELSLEARLMLAGMSANKITEFSSMKSDATVRKKVREELGYLPESPQNRFRSMFLAVLESDLEYDGGIQSRESFKILLQTLNLSCDLYEIKNSMDHFWENTINKVMPWQLGAIVRIENRIAGLAYMIHGRNHFGRWAKDLINRSISCPQKPKEVDVSWVDWILNELQCYSKPFYDPKNKGGDVLISALKKADLDPEEWEILKLLFGIGYGLEPKKLSRIAEKLGVNRDRAKRLEVRALRKIRNHWPDFKKKFWPDEV